MSEPATTPPAARPPGWLERMAELARSHADAEARGDLEATLATLEDVPRYELQPMRRVFSGKDAARRCYEHFFTNFLPLGSEYELRGEWLTEEGLGQEYVLELVTPDGTRERHNVIGIILFGQDRLAGERVYASERLLRLMYGPVVDESEPLDP